MTSSSKARKCSIEINYNGMFVTSPFAYEGGEIKSLENLDFTNMEYPEFSDFLKKETDTVFSAIYYVIPGKELHNGFKLIKDDVDFKTFVEYGAKSKRKIALYLEHFDEDLTEYLEEAAKLVNHKMVETESENETDSMSDDNNDDDDDDDDDDDVDDDDDDEDEDTASIDHLSSDEVEVIELRKTKKPKPFFISQRNLHFDGDVDEELPKEETMETEHEIFLNQLLQNDDVSKEGESKYPRHNPRTHWKLMKPILGERYETPKQLKECITNYAVANGYQIWFERNDHMRLLARCSKRPNDDNETKCPYRLWATWMSNEKSFQIKSLVDEHKCARNFKSGSLVNYKWVANKFANRIIQEPEIKLIDLQSLVLKKYKCQVSVRLCHKARAYALSEFELGAKWHYGKLWEYAEEIKRSNPGSTVKVNVKVNPDGLTYFQGFYVCFEGLKKGWMKGCRKVLGLGECFLKSVYKGVLLSVVGRDGNNKIFPVAWAVVSVESKKNWSWFIDLVKSDLKLDDGTGVTLISSQHEGLMEAVNDVLPQAEHRHCARHIYNEFTEKFTGGQFRNLFWEASKASYPQQFDKVMEEIRVESIDAYQYLMDKDPSTWSRVFFQTNIGCDVVENGITECFNSLIKNARRKPVVTLLESIRVLVMDRMSKMREEAENWDDDICPTFRDKLEHTKELERFWRVIPCGGSLFEVKHGGDVFMVDEIGKTCSCRMWQLSSLPCPHAVAAIFYINKLPETYIPDWFRKNTFTETYSHHLKPLNGIKTWPKTKGVTPLAPKPINTPKRPKLRKRKREAMEVGVGVSSGAMVAHVSGGGVVVHSGGTTGGTVNREGRRMTCKKCLEVGHNVRSCKNEKRDSPRKEARQAGRKKAMIVVGETSSGRGGKRGRGRGRGRGLFGSDRDDVLGCGDDIPLAVWRPLLLLDKQDAEVAKKRESEMEVTLVNKDGVKESRDVGLNEGEERTPREDQGPIPIEVDDPVPHEDKEPILVKDQEHVPHDDKEPIPIEDEKPITNEAQEASPNEDQGSVQLEDQKPITIEDQKPTQHGDQDLISHEDQKSVPHEHQDIIIPNKDQDPISNGGQEPIIIEDQESISKEDENPIPKEDEKPIPNEEKKPILNEDQESVPNGGQEPILIKDEERIPHEDEESVSPQKRMRAETPTRESSSEKINNNKLRKVGVEKDGEGSSMDKVVVLDD